MKGNGRRNVWLALAAVVAACLVLAGCPHNGLLEGGGGGGLANGGGGRGGGDGVQLVITNFVADGAASRSASWLGGPQKTIAPEHIDLTDQAEIEKYVFVAEATGNGTYGPEFIDVAQGSGSTSLKIDGGGVWFVTVKAYEVAKFGDTKQNLVNGGITAFQQLPDFANALVLQGSATADLSSGNLVTLALTGDKITQPGSVDVAINFTTQTDVAAIFADTNQYTVTAELVNLTTQGTVSNTLQELFVSDGVPGTTGGDKTTDPGIGGYTHDTSIKTTAQTNKVLVYKPMAIGGAAALEIPKGKYLLRISVTDNVTNRTWYRVEPAFYVDGNRVTTGVFEIKDLTGTPPKQIDNFEVYYTAPTTIDQLEGYNATFAWDQNDFRAAGYSIEIADITEIYVYDGNTKIKTLTAPDGVQFANAEEIWTKLDTDTEISAVDRAKYVTAFDWKTSPQEPKNIRWVDGNLMGGSSSITLRLLTGHVYTARIRAVNGTHSTSVWQYVGQGTVVATPVGPTKFNTPATSGIFDLVKIEYMLKATDMYTLAANRNVNMQVDTGAGDVQVTGEDLLQFVEYNPRTPVDLKYGFEGEKVDAQTGDQVLTKKGELGIVSSWQGWQDKKAGGTNQLFGPASGLRLLAWTKGDWDYAGFKDLELEPAGAGGSSIILQAETSGTFNVLDANKVGFGKAQPVGGNHDNIMQMKNQTVFTNQITEDIYKNATETRLVVVIDKAAGAMFELYVSVGDDATTSVSSTLADLNSNLITINSIKAEIMRGDSVLKTSGTFTPATTDVPAYTVFKDTTTLEGMVSGEYMLVVTILTGQGYEQTMQMPITILYTDQAATATIP